LSRARALVGHTLGEIAGALSVSLPPPGRHAKGEVGRLIEAALGASGEAGARHDFPSLRVELKTVPVDARGLPAESTYVCTLHLHSAEFLQWETSWVADKLSCVLFVLVDAARPQKAKNLALTPLAGRVVRDAILWRPSAADTQRLRRDFEEIIALAARGEVERLTAHLGEVLQVRPKARNGARTVEMLSPEGALLHTVPRGFYLRPAFVASVLARERAISSTEN
jgi:DNA mismatch repair protein MutH